MYKFEKSVIGWLTNPSEKRLLGLKYSLFALTGYTMVIASEHCKILSTIESVGETSCGLTSRHKGSVPFRPSHYPPVSHSVTIPSGVRRTDVGRKVVEKYSKWANMSMWWEVCRMVRTSTGPSVACIMFWSNYIIPYSCCLLHSWITQENTQRHVGIHNGRQKHKNRSIEIQR